MNCRHCETPLTTSFIDLGSAPPSNALLTSEGLKTVESWFPLKVLVCESCWLVQTQDVTSAQSLFDSDYSYFSSYSSTWQKHCQANVEAIVDRFHLTTASHVIEVASNDGCLLDFVAAKKIPCTGIEPTASTAAAARQKGLQVVGEFFGLQLAQTMASRGQQADVMVANNVLAHVPKINDFVAGFPVLLKPKGVAVFEFPHLEKLIAEVQFDTIYHEHFSYLSLTAVTKIFASQGLAVFDVEELPTHGGSLRVFAQPTATGQHPRTDRVEAMLALEARNGITTTSYYEGFQGRAEDVKNGLLEFLLKAKREGKLVASYGAAAKGNTLMNFAGVRPDLLAFVVDRNPAKQNKFMPGSRLPIVTESTLRDSRPDFVVIWPWNLRQEITAQLSYIRDWGGQFVTAIPSLEIFS